MKKQMILLGMLMAFCMAEAKVTLPALFTDNMVLQQKSNVIFHGHSSTKKEVIIKTGWNKHPYTTSPRQRRKLENRSSYPICRRSL